MNPSTMAPRTAPSAATSNNVPANNVRGALARPQQSAVPSKPSVTTPSATNTPSSVPARPPPQTATQPRSFRNQPASTGTPSKSAELSGKPAEGPTTKSPVPAISKSNTPAPPNQAGASASQPNGKTPTSTPAALGKKEERPKPVAAKKEANSSAANGDKKDAKKEEEKKVAEKSADTKPEPVEKAADKSSTDEKTESPVVGPPKKNCSLYIKGIPVPTTEEEIKGLFPNPSKVSLPRSSRRPFSLILRFRMSRSLRITPLASRR